MENHGCKRSWHQTFHDLYYTLIMRQLGFPNIIQVGSYFSLGLSSKAKQVLCGIYVVLFTEIGHLSVAGMRML